MFFLFFSLLFQWLGFFSFGCDFSLWFDKVVRPRFFSQLFCFFGLFFCFLFVFLFWFLIPGVLCFLIFFWKYFSFVSVEVLDEVVNISVEKDLGGGGSIAGFNYGGFLKRVVVCSVNACACGFLSGLFYYYVFGNLFVLVDSYVPDCFKPVGLAKPIEPVVLEKTDVLGQVIIVGYDPKARFKF